MAVMMPWDNLLSSSGSLASLNPIRYRGYYYDSETALYYLQSRYYDPEVGRFLNADIYASTGQGIIGCNMFAYCLNNPVLGLDSTGSFILTLTECAIIALLSLGTVAVIVCPSPSPVSAMTSSGSAPFISQSRTIGRKEELARDTVIGTVKAKLKGTIIFRALIDGQPHFYPRKVDTDGVSFFSYPMTNHDRGWVTTVEAIEATGLFTVTTNGLGHYSVKPANDPQGELLKTWMQEGDYSIYTSLLKSICIPYSLSGA